MLQIFQEASRDDERGLDFGLLWAWCYLFEIGWWNDHLRRRDGNQGEVDEEEGEEGKKSLKKESF